MLCSTASFSTGPLIISFPFDKNATSAHSASEKGSYENSGKWRGIYAADAV